MPSMERFLDWANVVYIASLGIVLLSTIAIYQLSKRVTEAKAQELADYQTESEVKIAAAEERAAEANLSASQAQLELAKLKEPRTIAPEDQERIITELTEFTGQKYSLSVFQDPEALALLRVVYAMLTSAGWEKVNFPNRRNDVSAAGITAAITLDSGVVATIGPDDGASVAAVRALSDGLYHAGIPCPRGYHTPELQENSPNTILIGVGKKP